MTPLTKRPMILATLSLFLLAAVVWVLLPLRRTPEEPPVEPLERDDLEARHRQLLFSLQDLDFEMQTGKLSTEDHEAMRRRIQSEAIEILRRLEKLPPAGTGPGPGENT